MMTTADAKFWDDLAEEYAAKPVDNVPAYERKLEITKALLEPDQRVFDLGCGTGSLALELAPHVAEVHSMDISKEMLRIARGKSQAAGVTNVTFHQGTLDGPTGFEPQSFGGVCAYNILHLVEDCRGTLETLYEMLEPGGFFVSSTVCLGNSYLPYRWLLTVMRWVGKAPNVYILRQSDLGEEMRGVGFEAVTAKEVGASKTTAFIVARKPR